MATIEIDFEVFKALTARRQNEETTYNDVLREVFELGSASKLIEEKKGIPQPGDWVVKGVRFPAGTEFRATYKGRTYTAIVEAGSMVLNGNKYNSPSLAGVSITNYAVNGWNFWECRMPGKTTWQWLNTLRK